VACPSLSTSAPCKPQACPIDCVQTGFSGWSGCSEICGGGVDKRTRSVLTNNQHGGKPCDIPEEVKSCNTHPCPIHCEYEWQPWSGCSVSCGKGFQTREIVVLVAAKHGGRACPNTQSRMCNTHACPTPSPTPAPTPAPTPPPTPADSTPVLTLLGKAGVTIEADLNGLYVDAGASCTDSVWGDLSAAIKTEGTVSRNKPGTYPLTYKCTNPAPWKRSATPVSRTVVVQDTTIPVCNLKGAATVSIEASFPYTDAGATCTDNIDGVVSVVKTGSVNIEKEGTYKLTYTAKDKSANAAKQVVRTIKVSDTLKPVIALKYGGQTIHKSAATDKGVNGESNPAQKYLFGRRLMAEAGQGSNVAMIGAIAACVAGIALVASTMTAKKEAALGQLV